MQLMKLSVEQAALLCAAVATLLYLNSLPATFCFDDLSAIRENEDLRPSSPWTNLLWNDFWGTPMHTEGSHKSYRPLCVATFRLNYMLHGLQPMGYHLVNVVLHAVVCYLYVQLCALVLKQVWVSLLAGLLFAAHPIHTEAVSGVVGRAELLSSLLFLLTLGAYRQACTAMASTGKEMHKGLKWLLLSLLFCFLSVLSKEQGITAVAVCITFDLFIFHQHTMQSALKLFLKGGCSLPRELTLRIMVLLAFTAAVLLLRLHIMQTTLPVFTVHDNPAVAFPAPYRQLHWLYLITVNLWLLLSPSFLCADWSMGTIPPLTSLYDPRHLLSLLTLLSVFVFCIFSLTSPSPRAKVSLLALALMVFPFLPASNLLFPVGFVVAERVLYLPSMGFCMLVAYGLWRLSRTWRRSGVLMVVLLVFLGLHGAKTVLRNQDWRNDNALFHSAIRINSANGKLYNNLGHDYESKGNYTRAEQLFRVASKVQPDDIGAYINLGRMLKQLGSYQQAEQAYKQAIELIPSGKTFRLAPSHINVYYNLANLVKMDEARLQEAFQLYQKAISMKPNFVEAHLNKGDLLLKLNQTQEARQAFETALSYNHGFTDAHYNLGSALLQLGQRKEAEKSFRTALSQDPQHIHALMALAGLLQEQPAGQQEALQLFQQVLTFDPANARAYFSLALLFLDQQDLMQSEAMFLQALAVEPSYRSARYNLGVLYNHQGRTQEAIQHLTQLVSLYPEHLNGAQLLADCYMKTNQPDKAEETYSQVLLNNPSHVPALHNLGVVKAESGMLQSAQSLFQKALSIDPSHTPSKKHLQQVTLQLSKQNKTKPLGTSHAGSRT